MMYDVLVNFEEDRLAALDMLLRQKEQVAKASNKKVNAKDFVF